MDTAATKDIKYKLIKKISAGSVIFNGKDKFSGTINIESNEVTATEDNTGPNIINNPDSGSSSSLKISSVFTLLFLLF